MEATGRISVKQWYGKIFIFKNDSFDYTGKCDGKETKAEAGSLTRRLPWHEGQEMMVVGIRLFLSWG